MEHPFQNSLEDVLNSNFIYPLNLLVDVKSGVIALVDVESEKINKLT